MSNERDSTWTPDGDPNHPSMDLLVAHHERRLEGDEADALAEHLSRCSHCTQMVLDLAAFPSVGNSDHEALADEPTLDEAWEDFSRALPEHETPSTSAHWWQLLAASVAWLALGFAAGSFWQESRDGARLAQAELNVPIVDLFPTTFARGAADDVPVIPTETASFVLILNPSNPDAFDAYDLDIIDSEGRSVWRATATPTNSYGGFTLSLSRQLLDAGSYRVQLFAGGVTPPQALETFHFEVPAD